MGLGEVRRVRVRTRQGWIPELFRDVIPEDLRPYLDLELLHPNHLVWGSRSVAWAVPRSLITYLPMCLQVRSSACRVCTSTRPTPWTTPSDHLYRVQLRIRGIPLQTTRHSYLLESRPDPKEERKGSPDGGVSTHRDGRGRPGSSVIREVGEWPQRSLQPRTPSISAPPNPPPQ